VQVPKCERMNSLSRCGARAISFDFLQSAVTGGAFFCSSDDCVGRGCSSFVSPMGVERSLQRVASCCLRLWGQQRIVHVLMTQRCA
jgi:hypothetical protein